MAHKWARWLHNPCHLGGRHRFRAGGRIRGGPQVGKVATSPLPPGGVSTASEWGVESEVAHKWARWLHNPCRLGGVPTVSERGAESKVAHKWGRWLHNPCRLGGPTASEQGAESEVAHKWARWLHNPCHLGGSRTLHSGGHNQRWPTSGQGGYITPATWGGLHRFRVGRRI